MAAVSVSDGEPVFFRDFPNEAQDMLRHSLRAIRQKQQQHEQHHQHHPEQQKQSPPSAQSPYVTVTYCQSIDGSISRDPCTHSLCRCDTARSIATVTPSIATDRRQIQTEFLRLFSEAHVCLSAFPHSRACHSKRPSINEIYPRTTVSDAVYVMRFACCFWVYFRTLHAFRVYFPSVCVCSTVLNC